MSGRRSFWDEIELLRSIKRRFFVNGSICLRVVHSSGLSE